jgi:acyl-CoA synthetase (AMP-forming)/AMP-acid ligase II
MIISAGENVTWADAGIVLALDAAVVGCLDIGVHDGLRGERAHALVVLALYADRQSR